jgi:hypothetical protein
MASAVAAQAMARTGSVKSAPSVRSITTTAPASKPSQAVSLPRRLLFPNIPPHMPLPRILADPNAPLTLDDVLYEFIALALRAFVQPWWTKLTRYDRSFLPHTSQILVRVIRVLEARLQAADLTGLLCCEIPALVQQHYMDYRGAQEKCSTAYAAGGAASLPQLFHRSQFHMAVSADGTIEEEYFRQAVDHILQACLPPEDYEPETERFIVREIIVMVVARSVIPKVTQPWFIHQSILNLLEQDGTKVRILSTRFIDDSNDCSTSCCNLSPRRPASPSPSKQL